MTPLLKSFQASSAKTTPDFSPSFPFFLHLTSHQRLLTSAQDHQFRGSQGSGPHQREDAATARRLAHRRQPQLAQQGSVLRDQRHRCQREHQQQQQQHPVKASRSRRRLGRRGRLAPSLITARHRRKGAKGEGVGRKGRAGVRRGGEVTMAESGGTSYLLVFGNAFIILVHSQIS